MNRKTNESIGQGRGYSGLARVLTVLALLITAATGAWAQEDPEGTPTVSVSDLKYEGGLYFYEVTATAKQAYGMDTDLTYTTDGTTPTSSSPAYTGPIKCYKNQTVKFQAHLMGTTIPDAAKDATITFSFEGPTITVDGAKVTISTNLNNATTYYKLNGGDAVEGTEVTLTQSATVTAYVVVTNGTYANFTSSESSKEVALQDAPSGPEVAWNKASKSGTFTMPGGNVTLEPEYYPQATVADGGVTAADADARATTDDPLVKVDATKLTGAKKLMYFVSNSGTTAPAYDAEGWTDQLPTAEGFTQQGIVYVWYYPVGTDEGVDDATATYSDGDICLQSITARIAAAPTYAVTFAEGTDPNEWTADPNTDVTKDQTVTVTYTGTKKVIGVKAEKKAAAGIVNPVVGQIIGSDGNNYDANATLPDGVTKVAMIAYVSGSNGLALALTDISLYGHTWDNTGTHNEGKTAPELCSALNTSKAVTGGTWKLPSKDEWKQMFSANGGNEGSYTGLNTAIGNAGGTALQEYGEYWSSSEDFGDAWLVYLSDGNASWDTTGKHYDRNVRACLAF